MVSENALTPGGVISSLPSELELRETVAEDDPEVGIPDRLDRFQGDAVVENLGGIFEVAVVTGGASRNIMVAGAPDGSITVGSTLLEAGAFTGDLTFDNRGSDLRGYDPSGGALCAQPERFGFSPTDDQ